MLTKDFQNTAFEAFINYGMQQPSFIPYWI